MQVKQQDRLRICYFCKKPREPLQIIAFKSPKDKRPKKVLCCPKCVDQLKKLDFYRREIPI